jgi:hypothetical protein
MTDSCELVLLLAFELLVLLWLFSLLRCDELNCGYEVRKIREGLSGRQHGVYLMAS